MNHGTMRCAWILAALVIAQGGHALEAHAQPGPRALILDTDLGPDSDDAGALAMLHALEARGEAQLLGVVCSTLNPWCAPAADVINTHYGAPDIPIGTLKGPGPAGTSAEWYGDSFNGYLAGRFPNDVRHGEFAEDAVALYRRLLAAEPDSSVSIVAVGGMTNLRDLLVSAPDSISDLSGEALVARKVHELVVMGGAYPNGHESNFAVDGPAAQYAVAHWPTRIVFSGYELGEDVLTGPGLWALPEAHPVRVAYHLWDLTFARRFTPEFDPLSGIWPHSSFDQTAVLYAVRGARDYWTLVETGHNVVHEDGSNVWATTPDRTHAYLVEAMPRDRVAAVIEALMLERR